MLDEFGNVLRDLLELILPLYKTTEFAFSIASGMCLVAIGLLAIAVIRNRVQTGALASRTRRISGLLIFSSNANGTATDEEQLFTDRFADINAALESRGPFSRSLRTAWRRYRRTLTFIDAPPIRATQRPSEFLYDVVSPPTWIGFAASLFVAFGLLATFLGLIAALTFATQGMSSSEPAAMQAAMKDLLASAASKFITSVTGVGLSIILRLAERLLTISLRAHTEQLSSALEFGIRVDPGAHNAAIAEKLSRILDASSITRPGPTVSPASQHPAD